MAEIRGSSARELRRRSAGWYGLVVAHLVDQISEHDIRLTLEEADDPDLGELLRTIREWAIRAIEEERPAEHVLLEHVASVIERIPPPVPFGDDDRSDPNNPVFQEAALHGGFRLHSLRLVLDKCDEWFEQGAYTRCIDAAATVIEAASELADGEGCRAAGRRGAALRARGSGQARGSRVQARAVRRIALVVHTCLGPGARADATNVVVWRAPVPPLEASPAWGAYTGGAGTMPPSMSAARPCG